MLQWNCRSIIDKRDDLILLLNEHEPHIVAINESWLSDHQQFSLPGYRIARKDRAGHGGGVFIAVLNHLNVEISEISSNFEVVCCNVQMIDGSVLSVASIYLPSAPFIVLPAELNHCIAQMKEPRLLLGDFNAHGVDWGCNVNDRRSQALLSVFDDNNMTTLNTGELTRIAPPPDSSSAIDLSVCSVAIAFNCTWNVIDHPSRSDHLPIIIIYNNQPIPLQRPPRPRSLTKYIDWQQYRRAVQEQLPIINETESSCELYRQFVSIIRSIDSPLMPRQNQCQPRMPVQVQDVLKNGGTMIFNKNTR